MSMYQCGSCGGTYSDTCPDGSLYFHVCPPLGIDAAGNAVPRPNARNENPVFAAGAPPVAIVAEGKGRTLLPTGPPVPTPPAAQPGIIARVVGLFTGR